MDDNYDYDNMISDLRSALYGLPFTVTDRSNVTGYPFFEINRDWLDNREPEAIGFVALGFTGGGWFGGHFGRGISERKSNMRSALVWLLNEHIDKQIGR